MAEVILAQMRVGKELTKLAVLKSIWPHLAAKPEFVSMFLHEAGLCTAMNHPNIVQTYEVLEHTDRPAIAMEYLDGQPLARVLNRLVGPDALSMTLRLRIVANVLTALDYAHDLCDYRGAPRGIVHRDVNPQNVFLTYGGQVKLVDFGVAKSLSSAGQPRPGAVHGKLAYMAPEQLRGENVDRRADLFSVGILLWEMVAGQRLWQGMPEATIIHHLMSGTPIANIPATAMVPKGLDDVLARALAHDPAARFATAAEFEAQLERLLAGNDDSHGRRLGHVVSLAFAKERLARQALIEKHLGSGDAAIHDPTSGDSTSGGESSSTPPVLPSLRPSRPTPGGSWTLSDPLPTTEPASVREAPNDVLIPAPPEKRNRDPFRLRPLVARIIPTALRRRHWTAVGVGLALLVVAGAFALRPAAPGAASPGNTNSHATTDRIVAQPPGSMIIAPIHPHSVIPWPLLVRPGAPPELLIHHLPATNYEGEADRLSSAKHGGRGNQDDDGAPHHRPRERRAALRGDKVRPGLPYSEDEVLEPTVDLPSPTGAGKPPASLGTGPL
jgi:serine/threonine-protein kinase